jgi:hypothetical protein
MLSTEDTEVVRAIGEILNLLDPQPERIIVDHLTGVITLEYEWQDKEFTLEVKRTK